MDKFESVLVTVAIVYKVTLEGFMLFCFCVLCRYSDIYTSFLFQYTRVASMAAESPWSCRVKRWIVSTSSGPDA